ncbi:Uncharacterised protein [Vibrio cholerae]|uniref:Uncharacterized protein n=1 Tax=Vibrio cholerae TaxID=666 RepID=A0A655Y2G0_VIBCL|nr:Uncharacterised protein [Vibrio cholerae]CSC29785.1 Uncharacterised protein [Vibrio cholerae]CSI79932.1 Uncharacterised protein [Vibrio cholerae]CSI81579.1 Uncharacterised protein [Vibrio cholerae]
MRDEILLEVLSSKLSCLPSTPKLNICSPIGATNVDLNTVLSMLISRDLLVFSSYCR